MDMVEKWKTAWNGMLNPQAALLFMSMYICIYTMVTSISLYPNYIPLIKIGFTVYTAFYNWVHCFAPHIQVISDQNNIPWMFHIRLPFSKLTVCELEITTLSR